MTTNISFKKAVKSQSRLRLALCGPSGSGKTYTALKMAAEFAGPTGKVAVIDTERGSASKYADLWNFDVVELGSFHPLEYCKAIVAAKNAGYDVLVIDGLSPAWAGKDGALEQADTRAAKTGNKFTAWADVTPMQNELVETMLTCGMHLIATMRVKQDYVLETNDKGKVAPRKVGLGIIQRDGMDYEFDVLGYLTPDHVLSIDKSRCSQIDGKIYRNPGDEPARTLKAWLSDGVAMPVTPPAPKVEVLGDDFAHSLIERLSAIDSSLPKLRKMIVASGVEVGEHPAVWPADLRGRIDTWIERQAQAKMAALTAAFGSNPSGPVNGHTNGQTAAVTVVPTAPVATVVPALAESLAAAGVQTLASLEPRATRTPPGHKRKQWFMPERSATNQPQYWRGKMLMSAESWLRNQVAIGNDSAKGVTAEHLVQVLEEMRELPEPNTVTVQESCTAYRTIATSSDLDWAGCLQNLVGGAA